MPQSLLPQHISVTVVLTAVMYANITINLRLQFYGPGVKMRESSESLDCSNIMESSIKDHYPKTDTVCSVNLFELGLKTLVL